MPATPWKNVYPEWQTASAPARPDSCSAVSPIASGAKKMIKAGRKARHAGRAARTARSRQVAAAEAQPVSRAGAAVAHAAKAHPVAARVVAAAPHEAKTRSRAARPSAAAVPPAKAAAKAAAALPRVAPRARRDRLLKPAGVHPVLRRAKARPPAIAGAARAAPGLPTEVPISQARNRIIVLGAAREFFFTSISSPPVHEYHPSLKRAAGRQASACAEYRRSRNEIPLCYIASR